MPRGIFESNLNEINGDKDTQVNVFSKIVSININLCSSNSVP